MGSLPPFCGRVRLTSRKSNEIKKWLHNLIESRRQSDTTILIEKIKKSSKLFGAFSEKACFLFISKFVCVSPPHRSTRRPSNASPTVRTRAHRPPHRWRSTRTVPYCKRSSRACPCSSPICWCCAKSPSSTSTTRTSSNASSLATCR